MKYLYLTILVSSVFGIGLYDYVHRLFFFRERRKALMVLALVVGFFLLWDVAGILLNVFYTNQKYVSGVYFFTPDMPLEEILFLTLVGYVSVMASLMLERKK